MKAADVIRLLDLKPLTIEGGYYRETARSEEMIAAEALPERYGRDKTFYTCIYFLITQDTFSILHKIPSDEIFYFHMGSAVEMLQLYEDGRGEVIKIGNELEAGCLPQVVVPKNVWQGCRLAGDGEYALMSVSVSPGFDFDDFVIPKEEEIVQQYPDFETQIRQLM